MAERKSASFEFKDKEVKKFFKTIDKNLFMILRRDKKYVGTLAATVFQDIIDHFNKAEGPDGPWPLRTVATQESYARAEAGKGGRRSKVSPNSPLLQQTGRLRNGFLPIAQGRQWKREKRGAISWFNPKKTKSGFPYAYAHDNDDAPRDRLPQRSFMWLSDGAMQKIGERTLAFWTTDKRRLTKIASRKK